MGHFLGVLLSYIIGMNSNMILIPRLSLQQVHQLSSSKPIKNLPPRHCGWNENMRCNFARPDTVTGQLTDAPGLFTFKPVGFFAEPL